MAYVKNELIGLIYDAALEPKKWAELLDALAFELGSATVGAGNKDSDDNLLVLQYHLEKAFTISERLDTSESAKEVTQSIANLLSVPALVLDPNLKVLSHNVSFDALSANNPLMHIKAGLLSSNSNTLTFKLKHLMSTLAASNEGQFLTLSVRSAEPNQPTSLLVSKLSSAGFKDAYLVLVASWQTQNYISEAMLAEMYHLTSAEQRLSLGILRGESLNEIAINNNVSIHTVRTQLKSVFSKVGVNRQSELMRVLVTGSLLNVDNAKAVDSTVKKPPNEATVIKMATLNDGRKLAYAEYGDPDGEPVIAFHPTTGSKLQCHPNNEMTRSFGVRLIMIDRPGFGLSSRHENRNFISFAQDVGELAQSIGLNYFSLLGYCGGGPYSMACAVELRERVKHLTVVSGVTPYDSIDLLHGASTVNRLLVKIATLVPNSIFHIASILAKKIINEPEVYLDELQGDLCDTDKAALNEPEFLDNFMMALGDSLRQGAGELAREQLLFSKDWGFDIKEIKVSTDLWYGDQDKHVPMHLARRLFKGLTVAQFHEVEHYGHFMIYHKWSDILAQHMSQINQKNSHYGT